MKQITIALFALLFLFSCDQKEEPKNTSTIQRAFGASVDQPRYELTTTDTLFFRYQTVKRHQIVEFSYDSFYVEKKPIVKDTGTTNPPPTTNYGTLIYASDFNTQKELDPWGNNQIGNGSLSSTIYRSAPYSFKSVPLNVSSGIRSEVQFPTSMTPSEGVIEYDVLYERIFQNSGHSLQFHPLTSGGSASPGLWHEDGRFVWVNWKNGTNTKYPTNFTIPQNKWMHIVFQYKVGSAGYMKFTVDGVLVLNKTGIQVGDGSGQYLKVGVNMWVNQTSVVYYDNLRIYKK